jgi:hypothetical protein
VPQAVPRQRTAADGESRPAEQTGPRPVAPRERRSAEAIDLFEVAGPSVAKRAAPVAAGFIALFAIWRVFRRRRGRHHQS